MTPHLIWAVLCLVALGVGVVVGRRIGAGRAAPGPAPAAPEPVPEPEPAGASDADKLPPALWGLPLGIVIADADGRVVYRNELAQGFAGGRHGPALVEAAIDEAVAATARSGGVERHLELYGPPRRHLTVKATPMLDGGRATGTLVIVEDVTEQHRIDAVRRDFVANVSHELKTPVGAIGVLAEALRGEDDPEVVDRLAGRLQDEAMRLGTTIDDLLALSRIESGEVFDPVELDLHDVASAAVERNASAAELRDVAVDLRRASSPVLVQGDRRQLVSAVANLVENAVKYSDPGSQVSVVVDSGGGRGRIEVVDRGIGIPEGDRERIFERFYRVDPARSRYTGGTGLGLSIVRHVALNHAGNVIVRSAEGEGSSFVLALPLADSAPAGADQERSFEREATPTGVVVRGE